MNVEEVHVMCYFTKAPLLRTTLQHLYFSETQGMRNTIERIEIVRMGLCSLPHDFASMFPNVKGLDMTGNQFKALPTVICAMTQLRSLFVNHCKIERIPSGITRLTKMDCLWILRGNAIEDLFLLPMGMIRIQMRLPLYSKYFAAVEQRERHAVAAVMRYLRARSAPDIARMIGQMIWRAYQSGQCVLNDKK